MRCFLPCQSRSCTSQVQATMLVSFLKPTAALALITDSKAGAEPNNAALCKCPSPSIPILVHSFQRPCFGSRPWSLELVRRQRIAKTIRDAVDDMNPAHP